MKKNDKFPIRNSSPFIFPFPACTTTDKALPSYVETACYHGGGNLLVRAFCKELFLKKKKKTVFKDLTDEDAWDFFYDNASFESIIASMQGTAKIIHGVQQFTKDMKDKAFLEMIRDDPHSLFNNAVLNRFVNLLQYARYTTNRDERKKVKFLLRDYLISLHDGGKKILLPNQIRYDLAVELLERLAKHLSEKIKIALRREVYGEKDDFRLENEEAYNYLKDWAATNKEYRICTTQKTWVDGSYRQCSEGKVSKDDLKILITSPKTFVEKLLMTDFHTSLKTISRSKKNDSDN